MIRKTLAFIVFLSFLLPGFSLADTVFLKDGSEIKGDIIRRDSAGVLIECYVTSTIKDQKSFSNDEITRIVSVPPDESAFQALGSSATPATVLDSSFYDALIEKKIPEFLSQYPYSKHVTELREELRSLKTERDRVNAGDRRIDGVWIKASQISADPSKTGAKIQFNEFKKLAGGEDPVATLKAFELLEKNYPGSSVFPDTLEMVPAQFDKLQAKLSEAQANYDTVTKKRQIWLNSAPPDQAKELKLSLDNETLAAKSAMASALKDGSKFFSVFPNVKEALDQLQALLVAEKARVKLLQVSLMRDSLADTAKASGLISGGNLKEAQNQLDAAAKLWPANAEIAVLKQKITDAAKVPPSQPSPVH